MLTITLPVIPPYFTTPRLDYSVAQKLQIALQTNLLWLDRAYHIAKAGVNANDKYVYPQIQANDGSFEHFDIRPDNVCPSYCFFEIDKPFELDINEDALTCYFSLVFWNNLDLIDTAKNYDFTSELIKEVTDLLAYYECESFVYETRPERIFDKYNGITQELKQHLMRRNSAFKISFKITDSYSDSCNPDAIDTCQLNIDRINNLEDSVRTCVAASICAGVGDDVLIKDQDENLIATVPAPAVYHVLVFNELYDDIPFSNPTDEIYFNPF